VAPADPKPCFQVDRRYPDVSGLLPRSVQLGCYDVEGIRRSPFACGCGLVGHQMGQGLTTSNVQLIFRPQTAIDDAGPYFRLRATPALGASVRTFHATVGKNQAGGIVPAGDLPQQHPGEDGEVHLKGEAVMPKYEIVESLPTCVRRLLRFQQVLPVLMGLGALVRLGLNKLPPALAVTWEPSFLRDVPKNVGLAAAFGAAGAAAAAAKFLPRPPAGFIFASRPGKIDIHKDGSPDSPIVSHAPNGARMVYKGVSVDGDGNVTGYYVQNTGAPPGWVSAGDVSATPPVPVKPDPSAKLIDLGVGRLPRESQYDIRRSWMILWCRCLYVGSRGGEHGTTIVEKGLESIRTGRQG